MKFRKYILITIITLVSVISLVSFQDPKVNANETWFNGVSKYDQQHNADSFKLANNKNIHYYKGLAAFKLKRPTNIYFYKVEEHPWKNHVIGVQLLKKGTIVYAWFKGTEGILWVGYANPVHNNNLTSIFLTNNNCRPLKSNKLAKKFILKHFNNRHV